MRVRKPVVAYHMVCNTERTSLELHRCNRKEQRMTQKMRKALLGAVIVTMHNLDRDFTADEIRTVLHEMEQETFEHYSPEQCRGVYEEFTGGVKNGKEV